MMNKIFSLPWTKDLEEKIHRYFPGRYVLYCVGYGIESNTLYINLDIEKEEETYLLLKYGAIELYQPVVDFPFTPYVDYHCDYIKE